MVTPFMAAAVEEAPLVECALNCGSMPLATIACFSHLAIIEIVTGLWGELTAKRAATYLSHRKHLLLSRKLLGITRGKVEGPPGREILLLVVRRTLFLIWLA